MSTAATAANNPDNPSTPLADAPVAADSGKRLAADPRYQTAGTGHQTTGVPSHLAGSAIPWDYERIEELSAIFEACKMHASFSTCANRLVKT